EPVSASVPETLFAVAPLRTEALEECQADEIVLLPVDSTTMFVYWETRGATVERARVAAPDGALVVRLLAVIPSWHGPMAETRDLEIELGVGEWFVRDLPFGAALRAAVGWRTAQHFEPLSVAMRVSELPAVLADSSDAGVANGTREVERDGLSVSERARERVARASAAQGTVSWVALPRVTMPPPAPLAEHYAVLADAG
ncbi:MAG TPA: DUF4912 domain-containing protein, partial [Polyangiaceae bacterium]